MQRRGITGHCVDIKNKGNAVLTKLRRFTNLTPKLKATLVKTQLIPILEYPPIPITAVSNTQKKTDADSSKQGRHYASYTKMKK